MSEDGFARWIAQAKASGDTLSRDVYVKLAAPSTKEPVHRYASIDPTLYQDILTNCVQPDSMSCMHHMTPAQTGAVQTDSHANGMAAAAPISQPQ